MNAIKAVHSVYLSDRQYYSNIYFEIHKLFCVFAIPTFHQARI